MIIDTGLRESTINDGKYKLCNGTGNVGTGLVPVPTFRTYAPGHHRVDYHH
jgi:hypothetical protein